MEMCLFCIFKVQNIQFINFTTFKKKAFRGLGRSSKLNKHEEPDLGCLGHMNSPVYVSSIFGVKEAGKSGAVVKILLGCLG